MENVALSRLRQGKHSKDTHKRIRRLVDCGFGACDFINIVYLKGPTSSVTMPLAGKVEYLTYRSPEVHIKNPGHREQMSGHEY